MYGVHSSRVHNQQKQYRCLNTSKHNFEDYQRKFLWVNFKKLSHFLGEGRNYRSHSLSSYMRRIYSSKCSKSNNTIKLTRNTMASIHKQQTHIRENSVSYRKFSMSAAHKLFELKQFFKQFKLKQVHIYFILHCSLFENFYRIQTQTYVFITFYHYVI